MNLEQENQYSYNHFVPLRTDVHTIIINVVGVEENCTLKMFILLHVLPVVGAAENYKIQKARDSNPKQI